MNQIKTPWNQPLDLPPECREFEEKFRKSLDDVHREVYGPDVPDSQLTDFQVCARAGVPLKAEHADGKFTFTLEKECAVMRMDDGTVLCVLVS